MTDAFWGLLLGVFSSLITTVATSEYGLKRLRQEQNKQDERDERAYQRKKTEEGLQRKLERIVKEIASLEAFAHAASSYYFLLDELGSGDKRVIEARTELGTLSGPAYRYRDLVEKIDDFRGNPYIDELQALLEAVGKIIMDYQSEIED